MHTLKKTLRSGMLLPLIVAAVAVFPFSGTYAQTPDAAEALSTIKKMVAFVRYSGTKPELGNKALDMVGAKEISAYLMDKYYTKATPDQDERFQKLILEYIRLRAFPTALSYIKDIDINYDEPVTDGQFVKIRSSVLYAGSERILFTWVVKKRPEGYFLTDFLDEKSVSAMQVNRDKQIQPLIQKEGIEGMIKRMSAVVNSYKK
jgi:ABC-type transporter MlaC component